MDVKEEGEISLDDVSSSEETNSNNWLKREKKLNMDRKYIKRVEVDILPQDAVYGKENRQYSNELHTHAMKAKPPPLDDLPKDGLFPISSEEDDPNMEKLTNPITCEQMLIPVPAKKKRKKKKKKKTGPRLLVPDDLESNIELPSMPTRITGDELYTPPTHYESSELHKKYSPPSAKLYRSPVNHFKTISHHPRASSPHRRSPRRLSPERSTIISDRYSQYKSSREHLPHRDETYMLLRKVRQFDNRYRETSKDRLLNKAHVLKADSDNYLKQNGDLKNHRTMTYDVEDEEDIDKLRRAALETKLQKHEKKDIEIIKDLRIESEDNSSLSYNAGDQNEEDLELRMIALRSAFQNKHRDRVQRGVVGKNRKINREDNSPSSDSLIVELFNDYKELDKESITAEGLDVEDMDLDSDLEREKENQPYSPTDGISNDKYSDAETFEPTNRVPTNSYSIIPRAEDNAPVPTYSQEFYPPPSQMAHPESSYIPSDPIQSSTFDRYLAANQFNYHGSYMRPMPPRIGAVPTSSRAETPYSPTDTPTFDPELPVCPSELSFVDNVTNAPSVLYPMNCYLNQSMLRSHNNGPNYIPPPTELNKPTASSATSHFTRDPRRAAALSRGVIPNPPQLQKTTPSEQPSVKPVEKPQEIISANSRIHEILTASKNKNDDRFEEIMKSLEEYTLEPAYLQGVPQVTKDANKIPTLVNRTLVPAPILKTNKQLQHKLPAKKPNDTAEKTFKNAEMQPVEIANQTKTSSTFKPIKLLPKTRKIQLIDLPMKGSNSINESSTSVDKTSESSSAVDLSKNAETLTTETEVKRKGRRPKTPTTRKTIAKNTPVKDNSKTSAKSLGKRSKENNKEVENSLEEKERGNEGEVRRTRGRPRSKSVNRTDKNEEENQTRESIPTAAKENISTISETNLKENDKKRRSSADEDEDTLREKLLASMYTSGLKKVRDDSTDKAKIDSTKDKSLITSTTLNEKSTTSTLKNNSTLTNNTNCMFVNNKSTTSKNIIGNAPVNARKRPGVTDVFGPPEKILKKTAIIGKNALDGVTKNLTAPSSPKMSKNVPRVVINLGEDSDSDSDSSGYSLSSWKRSNVSSVSLTDFDKRLHEFLKSQREKTEINDKVPSTSTGTKTAASISSKTSILISTPQAVRHLSASKQEEYRRLKQQLAEKEKQKLIRASGKKSQKSIKTISKSAEEKEQLTATNLQVKKTTANSNSVTASTVSTSPPSHNQGVFTNIPQPSRISSSLTPAFENLNPLTNIYPNNLMEASLTEEQQLLLPLDCSVKSDPDDFLTITEEPKVDPLMIENVAQNCHDEVNYDMPLESLGMRENLIVQISNIPGDNMNNQRKVLFAKDLNLLEETTPHTLADGVTPSPPAAPVLKVLTTAQLNMKIEQEPPFTNQEEMEEKIRLDENGQVVTPNTQPLFENIIQNGNSVNDLASQVSPVVLKSEPVFNSSEQQMPNISTQVIPATISSAITSIEPTQEIINTEEPAPVLPPKNEPEAEPSIETELVNSITAMTVVKSEVEENLEVYSKLPIEEQKTELSKIENDLVKKRYNVLSDVTEMIESLQQWEAEQNAKIKLVGDIARLRLELKMAEERFEEQKLKVSNMGPKIRKTNSIINTGKSECVKLMKLCQGLGGNISGNEYKTPTIGADILSNKLREIAHYTHQLFKKRETFNNQNNNTGSTPSIAHNNPTTSNGVGKPYCNEQQPTPLNLSIQPTSEVNENLPSTVKTEEPENQDSSSALITDATSDVSSTPVISSMSIINSSSVTDSLSASNPTLPVQPAVNITMSANQQLFDEFSLSKVKIEPVDTNETEGLENTPMEVDNGNKTMEDTQSTQVTELIAQIKTEKKDDEEIIESVLICSTEALKEEKNAIQHEESCENISNNNTSIRVIPSEHLISQRNNEERNVETMNTEYTDVGVNDKTVELSFNVDSDIFRKKISEVEKRFDNEIQNIEIKSETDSLSNNLKENDINSVEQASKRSAKAIVTHNQETWADFEEEKPPVTGVPYESVLTAFNTTRPVDPNGVLCPFELMGTCKDDSCTYNHLNADRKT